MRDRNGKKYTSVYKILSAYSYIQLEALKYDVSLFFNVALSIRLEF